jgi:sugar lactone lactonase YvrE
MDIQRLGTLRCKVGEGPIWDVAEQCLYFVDLLDSAVLRYDAASGEFNRWSVSSLIGSLAVRQTGGLLVALQDGLHTLDLVSGELSKYCDPKQGDSLTQFNDGKVDRLGRFLVGTQPQSLSDNRLLGVLFRVSDGGAFKKLDSDFGITNGPCWSPDDRTFYFADSLAKTIYAYDYDLQTGELSNRRQFADTSEYPGIPDGATVDTDGNLWVAMCGAGVVVCYASDGRVLKTIEMPVAWVTSVAFGGAGLDRLFVTSIDGAQLGIECSDADEGGSLYVVDGLGCRGLPEPRFAG